jgi:hypothetical protein
MNDHQIKRESSDTFGRNTKADLELLRRVADQDDYRSAQMLAMAVISAALLVLCGVAGVILYSIFA